jgi:hypothetical protein
MSEIFVRRFICNGKMTGIGSDAKTKSVKMLIAIVLWVSYTRFWVWVELTSIEEPNSPKGMSGVAFRSRTLSQREIPSCIYRKALKDQSTNASKHEKNQEGEPSDNDTLENS